MSKKVRIVNPLSGSGCVKRKRAEQFVASGRAEWVSQDSIRFRDESDYRNMAIVEDHSRASQIGYDGVSRVLSLRELRNIPFVGDVQKLLMVRGSCLGVRKF